MPCRDGSYPEDTIRDQGARLDKLTRLLCEASRKLEKSDRAGEMSQELRKWLEAHKIEDARREAQAREIAEASRLRKQALEKLTPAERRALKL